MTSSLKVGGGPGLHSGGQSRHPQVETGERGEDSGGQREVEAESRTQDLLDPEQHKQQYLGWGDSQRTLSVLSILFSPDHSGLLDGFIHSGESLGLPELLRPPPHLSVLPPGCLGLWQTLETLSCPSSHSLRLSFRSLLTGLPLPAGEELSLWALHLPHSRLEQASQVGTEKVLHLLSAMF